MKMKKIKRICHLINYVIPYIGTACFIPFFFVENVLPFAIAAMVCGIIAMISLMIARDE